MLSADMIMRMREDPLILSDAEEDEDFKSTELMMALDRWEYAYARSCETSNMLNIERPNQKSNSTMPLIRKEKLNHKLNDPPR